MRYAILGDVHSNWEALNEVLWALKKENIDEYFSIGDIVGYNASPKECIKIMKEFCKKIVAGNHDWACVGKFNLEWFNDLAKNAILWTVNLLDEDEKRILSGLPLIYEESDFTLVHGTIFEPDKFFYLDNLSYAWMCFQVLKTPLLFVGHTHKALIFSLDSEGNIQYFFEDKISLKKGMRYIVNVGSVGQPRDGDPRACFCIYDSEEKTVEFRRISYDLKKTQKNILNNLLPEELAFRLSWGR
ncbi:MAG: metallophosphatase family protein [Candidatus Omnitrophica bacterium]|nr:metallophosphatase family protein [Candidatus Omnitrophota bacterium]